MWAVQHPSLETPGGRFGRVGCSSRAYSKRNRAHSQHLHAEASSREGGEGVIEPARKRRGSRPVQRPASHCPTVEGANGRAQAASRRRVSHTSEKARQCDVSLRGVSAAQRRAALRISLRARETGSAPASKKTQASPASDRWGGFRSQGHHVWGLPRLLTDGVKTVSGNGGDERVRLACRHGRGRMEYTAAIEKARAKIK